RPLSRDGREREGRSEGRVPVLDLNLVPRRQPAAVLAESFRVLPTLADALAACRRGLSAHDVTNYGAEVETASHALAQRTGDVEECLLLGAEFQLLGLRIADLLGVVEREADPHSFDARKRIADRGALLPMRVPLLVPVVVEVLGLTSSGHAGILPPPRRA